jgi:hypothetical protein
MATMRAPRRSAARLATDRVTKAFVDASIAGEELPFPDGSCVIPADLVTEERIRDAHARGKAAVIVDEHENVRVLPPPEGSVGEHERDWLDELIGW